MTILVGVLCQDGVVVGSDSSATFASGNLRTIEQPVRKTFLVGNDVIFASPVAPQTHFCNQAQASACIAALNSWGVS